MTMTTRTCEFFFEALKRNASRENDIFFFLLLKFFGHTYKRSMHGQAKQSKAKHPGGVLS